MTADEKTGIAPTELDAKIIRQVEFYFGDVNLPRDKFLKEQIQVEDGWVAIETMLKFNRLRSLTEDASVVAAALRKSTSGLMEISEDGVKLRRRPDHPLPEMNDERKADIQSRTVYAKGFPNNVNLDELQQFFIGFGEIDCVQMRRKPGNKHFKGSVFVQFCHEADATAFIALDKVEFRNTPLQRTPQADYWNKRNKENEERKQEKAKKKEESMVFTIERPAVAIKLTGLPDKTTRELIKAALNETAEIEWIDFEKGEKDAFVRFKEANAAKTIVEKFASGVPIEGSDVPVYMLEGEEETQYWRDTKAAKKQRKSKRKFGGGGRGGRGGGRGGRGGRDGRKRQMDREDSDDGPAYKSVKQECDDDGGDDGDD